MSAELKHWRAEAEALQSHKHDNVQYDSDARSVLEARAGVNEMLEPGRDGSDMIKEGLASLEGFEGFEDKAVMKDRSRLES